MHDLFPCELYCKKRTCCCAHCKGDVRVQTLHNQPLYCHNVLTSNSRQQGFLWGEGMSATQHSTHIFTGVRNCKPTSVLYRCHACVFRLGQWLCRPGHTIVHTCFMSSSETVFHTVENIDTYSRRAHSVTCTCTYMYTHKNN